MRFEAQLIMKRLVFIFLALLCRNVAMAQPEHDTLRIPESIAPCLGKEYKVIDLTYGNLNLDTLQDVVVVAELRKEADTTGDGDRTVFLLIGTRSGYTIAARNDEVALCHGCGGMMDPYGGIDMGTGQFSIYNDGGSAWRWHNSATFTYNKKDGHWYATETERSGFNVFDEAHTSTANTKTAKQIGRVRFERFKYAAN